VDGDFTYAWSPTGATTAATSFFAPLGTTQVVVTVTDNLGESAQASSSVTVADTRRPAIFMMVSPTTLFPPNDAMVKVASDISASDACDPSPRLTVSVSSNEAPSNDWQIVANTDGTYDVYVRAAREGNGTGRIYTIRATATDASGNIFSKSQTVTVPHSQSNNQPKEKVSKAIRQ
jgi:hypothetical protein